MTFMTTIANSTASFSASTSPEQALLGPALAQAASLGDLTEIERLLALGADPLYQDSLALTLAASHGRLDCLRRLLPLSDPKADNSAALRCAAFHGHAGAVEILIPVSDPMANEVGGSHSAALVFAAERGHADCLRLLLPVCDAKGAQSRALASAASSGHLECLCLLLPVSDPAASHFRALSEACGNDHPGCAAALLAALLPLGLPDAHTLGALRDRTRLESFLSSQPSRHREQIIGMLQTHQEAIEISRSARPAPSRAPGGFRV